MANHITIDDVRHVAALARLDLGDERAHALVQDLNTILGHMDALSRVDTTGVAEAASVGAAGMRLREDAGPPIPLAAPLDSFAPAVRAGLLLVPRLSTH